MREEIDAVIEPIVAAARIASRRRRDELRRELRSHFEESGLSPDALREAVARFGDTAAIGDSLRRVYRRDYLRWYLVKVTACIAAATLAAILIEAIAGLRLGRDPEAWHLSPGFAHAAPFGVVLTLALVAAAEATRAPFAWRRALVSLGGYAIVLAGALSVNANSVAAIATASVLAMIGVGVARMATRWTARALLALSAFSVAEYLLHRSLGLTFGATDALAASAILVLLWASTVAIIAFSDRAFVRAFPA